MMVQGLHAKSLHYRRDAAKVLAVLLYPQHFDLDAAVTKAGHHLGALSRRY